MGRLCNCGWEAAGACWSCKRDVCARHVLALPQVTDDRRRIGDYHDPWASVLPAGITSRQGTLMREAAAPLLERLACVDCSARAMEAAAARAPAAKLPSDPTDSGTKCWRT